MYYYYFFIIFTCFILLVFFYFFSLCLVLFTWLVKLHCLTGFPCSLSHRVFLILSLSLHLYSNSTLLKVLYFLFLIFRSHRFYHMIVAPLLLQIIVVPYNCKYYTAALSDLISLHCFRNFNSVGVNSIISNTTPIFYPLLSLYLIIWPPISSLLSRSNSQPLAPAQQYLISFPPFRNSGYFSEISRLTLYISKESPISSLWVGTLNTIEYIPAVLDHFEFPL